MSSSEAEAIGLSATAKGITRICHFTPSRNLPHIMAGASGVLSTAALQADERAVFTGTDLKRLDNHAGYISCSIEYPNGWFFHDVRSREVLFRDWSVLLIDPKCLWQDGTLFSYRNAAAAGGSTLAAGLEAFERMYANQTEGSKGRVFTRLPNHLVACPTDDQAEVMVPDRIARDDIVGIAVSSEDQARDEMARLHQLGVDITGLTVIVVPEFYDRYALSNALRNGRPPEESTWKRSEV